MWVPNPETALAGLEELVGDDSTARPVVVLLAVAVSVSGTDRDDCRRRGDHERRVVVSSANVDERGLQDETSAAVRSVRWVDP
ncbi:hypothetical protein D8S78_15300 [Natrialba swarupiae]|nr:hypothetical protein [Natrialba swarupiae]